ncbi:putative divalent cation transporter [Encephalitozoon hellem]|nr:putative divalent cation transporter [Encephalitozoon hellem]
MFKDLVNLSSCNTSLLLQSVPGLLISLIGLIMTGSALIDATNDANLEDVPIILETNCILAFKGNTEVIFAMYLSSMSQSPLFMYKKYFGYVFVNSNLVLAQSAIIGLTIGLIGIVGVTLAGELHTELVMSMLTGSLVSCILTTAMFIVLLVISIEISKVMGINPDNIILPTISSFGDYMNVKSLMYFTKRFRDISIPLSLTYIFLSVSIVPLCLCFALSGKKRIPVQPIEVLVMTYVISTAIGYVLENFSVRFPILAPSFPVFSGMSVSIALIHLHKIFTSINNQTIHNSTESYITLTLVSLLMSLIYLAVAMLMGLQYSTEFCILFTISFVLHVTILLKGISILIEYLDKKEEDTSVMALPFITSVSDVLSAGFLLAVVIVLDTFGVKHNF